VDFTVPSTRSEVKLEFPSPGFQFFRKAAHRSKHSNRFTREAQKNQFARSRWALPTIELAIKVTRVSENQADFNSCGYPEAIVQNWAA
jgi:hypothetical protein